MQKKLHLSFEGFSALQSYPPHSVYYNITLLLFSLHFSILTVHKMHDHQSGMFNEFLFAPIHHLFFPIVKDMEAKLTFEFQSVT